jgi:hypothetical protein
MEKAAPHRAAFFSEDRPAIVQCTLFKVHRSPFWFFILGEAKDPTAALADECNVDGSFASLRMTEWRR